MFIPEAIYKYNVYDYVGEMLLGNGSELTLPDLKALTSTINGGGMLGEVDSPLIGMFGSTEFEMPFRILTKEAFKFMKSQSKGSGFTIRGCQQITNLETHEIEYKQMRVVVRGRNKGIKLGKIKAGESMDCSVTLEITYMLIEVEGETMLELDKFNSVYIVDGEDQLKEIRRMC